MEQNLNVHVFKRMIRKIYVRRFHGRFQSAIKSGLHAQRWIERCRLRYKNKKFQTVQWHFMAHTNALETNTKRCSVHQNAEAYTHTCLNVWSLLRSNVRGKNYARILHDIWIYHCKCDGGKLLKILAKASSSTVCVLHFYYKPKSENNWCRWKFMCQLLKIAKNNFERKKN